MHLGGITTNLIGWWTVQQARNRALHPQRAVRRQQVPDPLDRGPNFTRAFYAVFQATGARILRTAVRLRA